MLNRMLKFLVGALALLAVAGLATGTAAEKEKAAGVAKTNVLDQVKAFTINNIFNYYGNNGVGSYNTYTGNGGLEFPKGSGNTAIFEDGVVWGGFHMGRPNPKVGGSVYRHALQAGKITTPGSAVAPGVYSPSTGSDDPLQAKYRVFRVRPDVHVGVAFATVEASLTQEADLISRDAPTSAQALYDQYLLDWAEWPGKGSTADPIGLAPYLDVDSNGVYDPTKDVPGVSGADQTLYYVANDNNAGLTQNLAGCPPIGIEVHRTFWGYDRSNYLGNMIFASTIVINKSGYSLDSAFFVMWSDPDLGDSGDDFAACDVDRSLGYIYNGKPFDATYGTRVPAAGYDFFQGPIVATGNPADRAVFQLKYRNGFKNLGMSTFVFFTQGNVKYADPAQGSGGDVAWYRLMNGLVASDGSEFIDPTTNQATKFTLSGNPVSGQGWLDGTGGLTSGDRRICLVTGPFSLANADTQELVVASMVGLGGDRISSIAVLKWYSDLAQSVYDNLFNIPNPPPAPTVNVAALDEEIVLEWDNPAKAKTIESFTSVGYAFEGYNVYQLPGNAFVKSTARRLATYDKVNSITTVFDDDFDEATGYVLNKPVHFGTDAGLKRTYTATADAFRSTKLYNGTPYYFAVTAYSVNPAGRPTQLESSPQVLTIYPQTPNPGYRYATQGDTLTAVHSGPSDGFVIARVLNPTATTGGTYKVTFGPGTTWNILRTIGAVTDTAAKNLVGQDGANDQTATVDGIEFRVIGAPQSFKDFLTVANGAGAITPPEYGAFAFNGSGFPHPSTSDRPNGTLQQSGGVLTASQGWGIHTGMAAAGMSFLYDYFLGRVTQSGARWSTIIPYDFEIRFTAGGSVAWNAFTDETPTTVPFELWNIGVSTPNNTADDYRLFPYVLDVDGNGQFNILRQAGVDTVDNGSGAAIPTHSISGGNNDPFTDWFYWVVPANAAPGQAGYNAIAAEVTAGTHSYLDAATNNDVLRRMVLVGWNLGVVAPPATYPEDLPQTGTIFRIISTKPNTGLDQFTVTAPTSTANIDLAVEDVEKINVYPNPYIGFNTLEANKYERFVRFTHLPQNATLRVFNLAGVLVRTMKKSGASQFFDWDLRNENGFPVAAGMYVIHVDMQELGKTKVLKLGVIPEQQFIDRW